MNDPHKAIEARDEAQAAILEAIKKAYYAGVKITEVRAYWSGSLTVDKKDVWPPVQIVVEAQAEVVDIPDLSSGWNSVAKNFKPMNGKLVAELNTKR